MAASVPAAASASGLRASRASSRAVAAGGEAVEVAGEGAQRALQLAAQQEDQVGGRTLPEDGADQNEGLERAREPAPRVLRPLGDARDLPVLLGDEGDDAVRLAVGAGTEHERGGREFTGHGAASTPSSPMPHGATSRNLDKRGFGP